MSKSITVEELAANLAEHLAEVREGETLNVTEAGRTIATMQPPLQLEQKGVRYPFRNLNLSPRPKNLDIDPAQIVIDERDYERSGKKHGV